MDEIKNILACALTKEKQNLYNHIMYDLYKNNINMLQIILKDLNFLLVLTVPIIDIEPNILFTYYIYFLHNQQIYYNIFSKTFQKIEKIKYIIYYKNNQCVMCYCNYHEKLKKYYYRGIENEIAVDILKNINIYKCNFISIYLETFLEHKDKFVSLDDIRRCIINAFIISVS
jgi:hypothetical protein